MGLKSGSPRPFDDLKRKEIVEIPYEIGVEGAAEKKCANCDKLKGDKKTECMCRKWKGLTGMYNDKDGKYNGKNYEKNCKNFL